VAGDRRVVTCCEGHHDNSIVQTDLHFSARASESSRVDGIKIATLRLWPCLTLDPGSQGGPTPSLSWGPLQTQREQARALLGRRVGMQKGGAAERTSRKSAKVVVVSWWTGVDQLGPAMVAKNSLIETRSHRRMECKSRCATLYSTLCKHK